MAEERRKGEWRRKGERRKDEKERKGREEERGDDADAMGTRRGRGPTWFRSPAARDGEGTCCCGWRCCYGRACCCGEIGPPWGCCCVRLEEEDGESGSASDGDEGDPEERVREQKMMMGKGVLSG